MSVTARASVVPELAAELLADAPELAREMAAHLYATLPELTAREDGDLMAELVASTEANLRQLFWLLKRGAGVGEVTLPAEAASFMRDNVRRGIPPGRRAARLPARARVAVGPLDAGAAGPDR